MERSVIRKMNDAPLHPESLQDAQQGAREDDQQDRLCEHQPAGEHGNRQQQGSRRQNSAIGKQQRPDHLPPSEPVARAGGSGLNQPFWFRRSLAGEKQAFDGQVKEYRRPVQRQIAVLTEAMVTPAGLIYTETQTVNAGKGECGKHRHKAGRCFPAWVMRVKDENDYAENCYKKQSHVDDKTAASAKP